MMKKNNCVTQHGEVMTPPALVNEMLDQLPSELWSDDTKTYLDPCCGHGNFLVEIIKRKIDNGIAPQKALSTIFGVELLRDNVVVTKSRLLKVFGLENDLTAIPIVNSCIKCADILETKLDDMFLYSQQDSDAWDDDLANIMRICF